MLITRAIESRASDIHIEPFEDELKVRYRIDGVLNDIESTPKRLQAAVVSRIKIMAKLNIAERRLPQDGRIRLKEQTVTTEDQGGQKVIVIEPETNPQVIYVPVYDPYYVWGPPVWGYYPPLYYPYFGFGFGTGFNLSFCFGNWGGWFGWGWGPNWFGHSVYVNNYFFDHYGFHHPYYGGGYHGGSSHGGGYHGDGY